MTQTGHLHLPQFAASDRIHHDDFNDAFAKLDAAVAGRITVGSYTGNGEATRTIDLGFTPSAVLLTRSDGVTSADGAGGSATFFYYGGLALRDAPCIRSGSVTVLAVADGGFEVCSSSGSGYSVKTNASGTVYYYVAIA